MSMPMYSPTMFSAWLFVSPFYFGFFHFILLLWLLSLRAQNDNRKFIHTYPIGRSSAIAEWLTGGGGSNDEGWHGAVHPPNRFERIFLETNLTSSRPAYATVSVHLNNEWHLFQVHNDISA